jgi:hypothetical protein
MSSCDVLRCSVKKTVLEKREIPYLPALEKFMIIPPFEFRLIKYPGLHLKLG